MVMNFNRLMVMLTVSFIENRKQKGGNKGKGRGLARSVIDIDMLCENTY